MKLTLIAVLCFAFAACANNQNDMNKSDTDTAQVNSGTSNGAVTNGAESNADTSSAGVKNNGSNSANSTSALIGDTSTKVNSTGKNTAITQTEKKKHTSNADSAHH